jgi:hypothetical protein
MSRDLPSGRDLSILTIAVLVSAAVIVLQRIPAPTTTPGLANAGASAAPVTTSAPSAVADAFTPAQAPSIDSLPADTRAQLDELPPGTILVACNSSLSHYADGIFPEMALGWTIAHPGWRILLHGYCVDNPSEIGTFKPQPVP